jgi:hypothetical protein
MGKRKSKNKTLTKIDPSILKPKLIAVSQHAAHDGARVTTTVNPARVLPVSPVDPLAFDFDPGGFNEDFEEDEEDQEEESILREYYVARVCVFCPLSRSG